ncbi:MAG: hypothetical protein RI967_997 [Planctomycetota bacterium]
MGWGRTLFLGDIGNRLDIADAEREIAELRRELRGSHRKDLSQDERLAALAEENAQLKCCLTTLVWLLRSKNLLSAEELETMVRLVDGEDGDRGDDSTTAGPA